ncbi:hypothetical protein Zmor_000938 [Zophobas morio]|uniref:Telomerase reverse transcriptase n=1 Tax=Zophobas morio TaxID=2755281 RepID=A0AA38J5U9_9CUCU|nr:hypothetical protein Zmor_020772 [Zophobas morio]KAJ3665442.1 hypothetical protein Zmor_000938 [Zophobas morio]
MGEIYFPLSLKLKQKSPKKINISCKNHDLSLLNQVLNSVLKNLRVIKSEKCKAPVKFLQLLDKIIPNEYFGTVNHRQLFYKIVKLILTQSYFECVHSSIIIKGFSYNSIPWLNNIKCLKTCETLLMKSNTFLLERVVKPLILFYYKPVRTYNGYEIKFIRLEQWTSYETKMFNRLKKRDFLSEIKSPCGITARGYLKIVPKGELGEFTFRPLINSFRNNKIILKNLASKIIYAAREMNTLFSNIFDDWSKFVTTNRGNVFGIKLDIKDAYGNVNIDILCDVILKLPPTFLNEGEKMFIVKYVKNQLVVFRGNLYKWKHGLVQGDPLSSCLCELYLTYLDKIAIPDLDSESFMHRTVDDYFFCSTDVNKVSNFESIIKCVHTVNENKTQSNLPPLCWNEILYCGKIFNVATGEIKILHSFNKGYDIRHRFKLWNIHKPIPETDCEVFLRKVMSFRLYGNYFSKMELNTIFNSQKTVLENFFDGIVYVAYKFDATVMALRNNSLLENFNFVVHILERCVMEFASKSLSKIESVKGCNYRRKIDLKLLRILAYKAFILVFKRRNEVYKNLVSSLQETNNLKINRSCYKIDLSYFEKLPKGLDRVKINRKNLL